MRRRIQNSLNPEVVSLNFNRAFLIYLCEYHGNHISNYVWILAVHISTYVK